MVISANITPMGEPRWLSKVIVYYAVVVVMKLSIVIYSCFAFLTSAKVCLHRPLYTIFILTKNRDIQPTTAQPKRTRQGQA